jgi:hypothetical protein
MLRTSLGALSLGLCAGCSDVPLEETYKVSLWLICALGLLVLVLSSCSLYNHPYPAGAVSSEKFELHIVQVDDFGTLWDRKPAIDAINAVKESSRSTNTLVVVFIHGWHHNADDDDSNLQDSQAALAALSDELNAPSRRQLREQLTGTSNLKIIGIYVGWRGRSLPGFLDYGTAWWRKAAAERVGDGDVSELLERLQREYLRANAVDKTHPVQVRKPFTGLVSIGHSFGGQVLFKSVVKEIEFPLIERTSGFADVLSPLAPGQASQEVVPIDSLGDLNILLNPALEAYQFSRIDALYRQVIYPSSQTPQLVVFSADNDWARQWFFPIERGLTRSFRPGFRSDNDNYQGMLWGHALGEVESQQTHVLTRNPTAPDSLVDGDYTSDPAKIASFDFTGETAFGHVVLSRYQPENPDAHPVPNSPVVVVQTKDKIIDGHNGIFGADFREFLVKYVAFIEGKRLILRYENLKTERARQSSAALPPP